ncbi:DUF29 family protein [Nostoc sp.]
MQLPCNGYKRLLNVSKLCNRQLAEVDYENLIEELEDLAKNEKRRVRSL